MKKSKTITVKPLLTKTEKAAIKAARRILKKLTARYRDLEESEWNGSSDATKALDDYCDALAKERIDVDSVGCFIVLEDD
jgi:hypothetical protein